VSLKTVDVVVALGNLSSMQSATFVLALAGRAKPMGERRTNTRRKNRIGLTEELY
jgi:hypothetical protein